MAIITIKVHCQKTIPSPKKDKKYKENYLNQFWMADTCILSCVLQKISIFLFLHLRLVSIKIFHMCLTTYEIIFIYYPSTCTLKFSKYFKFHSLNILSKFWKMHMNNFHGIWYLTKNICSWFKFGVIFHNFISPIDYFTMLQLSWPN
jgi:hypothetical protein